MPALAPSGISGIIRIVSAEKSTGNLNKQTEGMCNLPINYEFLKRHVVQRGLRHFVDPLTVVGLENVPADGPVILVPKHEAIIDTFTVAAVIDRPAYSFAKAEYFESGRLKREFFERSNAIPVYRDGSAKAQRAVERAHEVLSDGGLLIIHPEGGRSIDGRVYRAKLSFVDIAIATKAWIVPVGIIGTRQVNPIGDWKFHKGPVTVTFGQPVRPPHHALLGTRLTLLEKRHFAKSVMMDVARMSKAPYVDRDLAAVKRELSEHDDA